MGARRICLFDSYSTYYDVFRVGVQLSSEIGDFTKQLDRPHEGSNNAQFCSIIPTMTAREKPIKHSKLSVLMEPEMAEIFDAYCAQTGHKKSTLVVRLIKEHLGREGFGQQLYLKGVNSIS